MTEKEFLDKHGILVTEVLAGRIGIVQDQRLVAEQNGWTLIAKATSEEVAELEAALRELEKLRG